MCRGPKAQVCTALGDNPTNWSNQALLPSPDWFEGQLDLLCQSIHHAANGQAAAAREILAKIRSDDLREWFVEHGQVSGKFRARHFGRDEKKTEPLSRDNKRTVSKAIKRTVFARDGYQCRYCGIRLISQQVLEAFGNTVELSMSWRTNATAHGVVLTFRPEADHVLNWNRGGATSAENVVTTCWSCNYGKAGYSLEELGVEDPRKRPPSPSESWDGLLSLLPRLAF